MQTRVKFCGMTRAQDVRHAVDLGVDALGFVFVKDSPRSLKTEQARQLVGEVPPFVMTVGLFMNAETGHVRNVLNNVNTNLLQFHGEEDEEFCRQFSLPYVKAIPMGSTTSVVDFCSRYPSATGFVLDSHAKGEMGGSGNKFAWSQAPSGVAKPVILAGGLTPYNVAEAVRVVQPYAVDVSSGIETVEGVKDVDKMRHFIQEVRNG